jgi:hypothetical protein
MKKIEPEKNYVSGSHDFSTHFWCGIALGGGVGAWMGRGLFESGWAVLGFSAVVSILCGLIAGHWGDRFWWDLLGDLLTELLGNLW